MTPTNYLRFVERESLTRYGNDGACVSKTVQVLQQKWEGEHHENIAARKYLEEWRDVPLVKEET